MRALVMLIALGVASRAAADAVEDAAQVHLDRGIAAFDAGDFAAAHKELVAARDLVPAKPNPYRWLALTEIQLGDCANALGNIEGFLSRVAPTDERVAEMTRWRELCRRTGVLRVDSTPTGATLRIDGAIVGATPYRTLSMRAGTHALVAEKRGHAPASRSVELASGAELDIHLDLAPANQPLRARWWFWPAVGAVALAVVGVTVVVATDRSETVLPPIHCDPSGCRP